jgi:uncharacterized SAM-binding protein YcdF (DUF218 family)
MSARAPNYGWHLGIYGLMTSVWTPFPPRRSTDTAPQRSTGRPGTPHVPIPVQRRKARHRMEQPEGNLLSWLRRRLGIVVLILSCAAVGITIAMWPRDDVPDQPDAIVVLGGAGTERVQLGIELRDRYDAVLVLSSSAWGYGYNVGLRCDVDVICVRPYPETTGGEAATIAALAESYGWDHVTVATTRFHTARARVLFRQCLGDRVSVVGARPIEMRGPPTYVREALGTLAALTVRRAC